jgi:hypothetical protein
MHNNEELDMGAVEKLKIQTVESVARECFKACDGDVQAATKKMAARVRSDIGLFRQLLDEMVESACYSELAKLNRANNSAIWNAPNYDPGGKGERVKALASGNALMFFKLPEGPLLGQAHKADVEAAADFYAKQAKDMGWKARWLQLVAKHVEGNKTVGKCLTEKQLAKLKERATNE